MAESMHIELNAALEAAARASSIILENSLRLEAKSSAPADITTQTDRDSQDVILQCLAERFPADAFRAEETTETLSRLRHTAGRMWIIDPIDGTRGFVTKNGEYSVMIALAIEGEAVVGVVAEPAFDRCTFAIKGQGCRQRIGNGEPKHVSVTSTHELPRATLIQSHTKPERGVTNEVRKLKPANVVETYSAGVKMARVADGSADLYVCDYAAMNDWDLAAGHVLVTEAGGRVSNLAGEPRVYGRESPKQFGGLLVSNGKLHDAAQRLLSLNS